MRINHIAISEVVENKIIQEHGVWPEEVESIFFECRPLFLKARDGRYLAIGTNNGYVTVVFEYMPGGIAQVVTAYPSSNWQIKRYRRTK